MNDIFANWQPWQVALADTAAATMLRYGIDAAEMRALARQYMLEHAANEAMAAHRAAAEPGAAPYRRPHSGRPGPSTLPRPEWQREVELGLLHMEYACPKCGATVQMKRMCPSVSPRIRTQLVCMNDACDWAAVSERGWDHLMREGIPGNVEVQ